MLTTWAGSEYTVATAAVGAAASSAAADNDNDGAFGIAVNPMAAFAGFAAVAGGALVGALVTV